MAISGLEKIKAIRERADKEIEAIKAEAVSEVVKRISETKELLASLQAEYGELTGKDFKGRRVRKATRGGSTSAKADVNDEKELADILKKADGNRLNRKGFNDLGYNLRSAIKIAKSDKKFGFSQNGPQGEVWLK